MAPFLFDGPVGQEDSSWPGQDPAKCFFDIQLDRSNENNITMSTPQEHPRPNSNHTTTSPLDTPKDIAFGLELKCLLPMLITGLPDPEPLDPREPVPISMDPTSDYEVIRDQAYQAIAATIRSAGHPAATIHEISRAGLQERHFWSSTWIIKRANSAEPTPSQRALPGYVWVPIEISSPKMRAHDSTGTYMRAVQTVMDALATSHRLVANYTCDIHVHVGRMDGQAFALPTLKRLGKLLWLAEPVLRSIRDPGSPNYQNVYTWGAEIREYSRLADVTRLDASSEEEEEDEDGYTCRGGGDDGCETVIALCSLEEKRKTTRLSHLLLPTPISNLTTTPTNHTRNTRALNRISTASSHLALGRLLSGPTKQYRRLGFNFSAFGEEDARARSNPRTVEFRIMEGTVRSDLVLAWLTVCRAVVDVAVGDGKGVSEGVDGDDESDGRFGRVIARLLGELEAEEAEERQKMEEQFGKGRGVGVVAGMNGKGERKNGREQLKGEKLEPEITSGMRAGRRFKALMRNLDVLEEVYKPLLDKVVREN